MLDFNHISTPAGTINSDVQLFVGHSANTGASITGQWNTWVKPRGANMVFIYAMGGGSAGQDGVVTAGGQGGGSGAMSQVLIPAIFVPDVLYIYSGQGGRGGGAGTAGQTTYVCVEGNTSVIQVSTLLLTANGAGATAGSFGSVSTIAMMPLAGRGIWNSITGVAGATGAYTATNTGVGATGGAGGGAGNSAGNGSNGNNLNLVTNASGRYLNGIITIGGTGAIGATPALAGQSGQYFNPFWYYGYGGCGGGGASSTAGGTSARGGNAALGGGGGGGGGGSTTNAASPGGDGGDGFVYIQTW